MLTIKDPMNTKFGMLFRLHPIEFKDKYNPKPETASEPSTFKQQHAHLSKLFDELVKETPSTDQQGSNPETTILEEPETALSSGVERPIERETIPSFGEERDRKTIPLKEDAAPLKPPKLNSEPMSHLWTSLSAVPRVHFTPVGDSSREAVRKFFS